MSEPETQKPPGFPTLPAAPSTDVQPPTFPAASTACKRLVSGKQGGTGAEPRSTLGSTTRGAPQRGDRRQGFLSQLLAGESHPLTFGTNRQPRPWCSRQESGRSCCHQAGRGCLATPDPHIAHFSPGCTTLAALEMEQNMSLTHGSKHVPRRRGQNLPFPWDVGRSGASWWPWRWPGPGCKKEGCSACGLF